MYTLRVNERLVAIRELACPHLRETTRDRYDCSCYDQRFERAPWCLSIPEARQQPVLAPDCPYRLSETQTDSPAPTRLHPGLVRHVAPLIRSSLKRQGPPPWLSQDDIPALLKPPTPER